MLHSIKLLVYYNSISFLLDTIHLKTVDNVGMHMNTYSVAYNFR